MNNPKIDLLPEQLINQIKAGEVIERPSALLKEVLENSIDASAKNITIEFSQSGLELIHVKDDGIGISYEDLPLAFTRHATSKISKFEHLYSLDSYGFRGEALAVASSISKVECRSFPKDKNKDAGSISFEGVKQTHHKKIENNSSGTSLFFKDLFFNTPVRLKFIKSAKNEEKQIKKVINAFLLTNQDVKFITKKDQEEKVIYPSDSIINRVCKVFKTKEENLYKLEEEYKNYKVQIFYSDPISKSNINRKQFVFVNKRMILDKNLNSFIMKSFQDIWGIKNYGDYCVYLSIPMPSLDVNVHPSKTEVRFEEKNIIFSLIKSVFNKVNSKNYESNFNNSNKNFHGIEKNNVFTNHENTICNISENTYTSSQSSIQTLSTNENIFIITNKYCIYRDKLGDQNLRVIEIKNALKFIFDVTKFHNDENENIDFPLIISEPLILNQDNLSFECLKLININYDLLNTNKILINSIPKYLKDRNYLLYIKIMVLLAHRQNFSSLSNFRNYINSLEQKEIDNLISLLDYNDIKFLFLENINFNINLVYDKISIKDFFIKTNHLISNFNNTL